MKFIKLGIMQPYFFPYIGYWQLINAVDNYVIYDDVNYIKGSWINRNRILMNGEAKLISLKTDGASQNKHINEVKVACDSIYKKKLLKTIEHCYIKAPYYMDVSKLLNEIIFYEEEKLSLYLENSIKRIADYLGTKTEIILSSDIKKDNSKKGQDKIIEICRILDASEYYNAIGGMDLYTYEAFDANEIKLRFLKPDLIKYEQYENEFEPNLSIIDVMMFNSKEEIKKLLESYILL